MKQILTAVVIVLALNFVVAAGGVGYLVAQHKLDRDKFAAIKEVVFPKPATAPATTESSEETVDARPTSGPFDQLTTLLEGAAGKPAGEQVQIMQHAFDAQTAVLDRRQRELADLQAQLELAKLQLDQDRKVFSAKSTTFDDQQKSASARAADKGFKESLALYQVMPPKQAKTIFLGLDDQTIQNYFTAMDPKQASKIIKEFKGSDETDRIQKIMERLRQSQASAKG